MMQRDRFFVPHLHVTVTRARFTSAGSHVTMTSAEESGGTVMSAGSIRKSADPAGRKKRTVLSTTLGLSIRRAVETAAPTAARSNVIQGESWNCASLRTAALLFFGLAAPARPGEIESRTPRFVLRMPAFSLSEAARGGEARQRRDTHTVQHRRVDEKEARGERGGVGERRGEHGPVSASAIAVGARAIRMVGAQV